MRTFKKFLTEKFTERQLTQLKTEYGSLKKIDPNSDHYKKLIKMLDAMDQDHLQQLVASKIPFVSMLAANRIKKPESDIKVGDRIRTKLGGQIPGIVVKVVGNQIHFKHATDTYSTVWSGSPGGPKMFVVDKSNVIKESTLVEESPPDPEIEKWIIANKERFIDQYGKEEGIKILYAKAWKMYNSK